jgi:hypothetical protein
MRKKYWLRACMTLSASVLLFGCSFFSQPSSLDLTKGDFLLLYSQVDEMLEGKSELVVIDQNGKEVSESNLPIQDLFEIEPLQNSGYALLGSEIVFLDRNGNINISPTEIDTQTFVYKEMDDLTYRLIFDENDKESILIKEKTGEKKIPLNGSLTFATHDSNYIYVSASDQDHQKNFLHIIDRKTNTLAKTIPLPEKDVYMIMDMTLFHDHLVMVTDLNKFHVMNTESQEIKTYDLPFINELGLNVIADGEELYFTNDSGDVVVFDTQFKQVRHQKLKKGILASRIHESELYLLFNDQLQIADKKTLQIKKEISLPSKDDDLQLQNFILLDKSK